MGYVVTPSTLGNNTLYIYRKKEITIWEELTSVPEEKRLFMTLMGEATEATLKMEIEG